MRLIRYLYAGPHTTPASRASIVVAAACLIAHLALWITFMSTPYPVPMTSWGLIPSRLELLSMLPLSLAVLCGVMTVATLTDDEDGMPGPLRVGMGLLLGTVGAAALLPVLVVAAWLGWYQWPVTILDILFGISNIEYVPSA